MRWQIAICIPRFAKALHGGMFAGKERKGQESALFLAATGAA